MGQTCYRHEDTNVVIMQETKGFVALMFSNSALMSKDVRDR